MIVVPKRRSVSKIGGEFASFASVWFSVGWTQSSNEIAWCLVPVIDYVLEFTVNYIHVYCFLNTWLFVRGILNVSPVNRERTWTHWCGVLSLLYFHLTSNKLAGHHVHVLLLKRFKVRQYSSKLLFVRFVVRSGVACWHPRARGTRVTYSTSKLGSSTPP